MRIKLLLAVCLPILAARWNHSKELAHKKEVIARARLEHAKYLTRKQEIASWKWGVARGYAFPRIASVDSRGRSLPLGAGKRTLVVFGSACRSCLREQSWKEMLSSVPELNVVLCVVQSTGEVAQLAQRLKDPRLYLVADPERKLHRRYGAPEGRVAFLVGTDGKLLRTQNPWSLEPVYRTVELIGGEAHS